MHRATLSVFLILATAGFVRAHPIPKGNRDRTIVVRLTPTAVIVGYRLEVNEFTAFEELPRSQTKALTDPGEIPPLFLPYFAPVFADNLDAKLDGRPLTFRCVAKSYKLLDHQRYDYRYEAKWDAEPGKEHVFTLCERNFSDDTISKILLSVDSGGTLAVRHSIVPGAALQAKAAEDRAPGDDERLRNVSATFVVEAEPPPASMKGGLPPDLGMGRPEPGDGQVVGLGKSAAPDEVGALLRRSAEGESPGTRKEGPRSRVENREPLLPEIADKPQAATASEHERWLLDVFLKSQSGLLLALLLAAGVGAVHALTPGHGKTMVAAYLVGQRGTLWHALLLGIVTTVTHTAAVLALALGIWLYFGDRVPPGVEKIIGLIGGIMVAGLGLWLLNCRLAGRADHVHFHGGHSHGGAFHSHGDGDVPHSHGHDGKIGIGPLVWLGIAGGILPCGDALALLMMTIKEGVPWLGPPLILAFSFGLASVLVGIGIGVVLTRRQLDARSGASARLRRLVQALPALSAVVVTALGLWMCYDSVHGGR